MFDGIKQTIGSFRDSVESTDTSEEDTETTDDDREEREKSDGMVRRARSLARGQVVIDEDDLTEPLERLQLSLLSNDVEMEVAERITNRIKTELVGDTRSVTMRTSSVITDAVAEALIDVLDVDGFDFDEFLQSTEPPAVIIFTGVNGVGKTTTIAKIAKYLESESYSVVLANADTFRAGANEQLAEHADRLGVKFISHEQGGDPAAVIYDAVEFAEANDVDVVLGDTAGRLHTNEDLMNQLEKINRVVGPDCTIFVDEAVAGQDAINRAREFNSAAEIDGAILTKADADTSGGAAISIAEVTGKPILFLGTGQGYDDLEKFHPESLVSELVSDA